MKYWFDTVGTIPEGVGFTHYSPLHIGWLVFAAVFIAVNCLIYRKLSSEKRDKMRKVLAALLVADELWKMFWLAVGSRYELQYLPLHLCSINIFVIAYHCFHPNNKTIGNFLYTVCIPGALAALLFPSWSSLPLANFMHLHSFTVHTLLVAYPVILWVNKDIVPELRELPKSLGVLFCLAGIALIVNILFDENFMFLMYAEPGNPLYIFEQQFGSHVIGFPIIISAVILVMYGCPALYRRYINHRDKTIARV